MILCTFYITLKEFVLSKYGKKIKKGNVSKLFAQCFYWIYFDFILFGVFVYGMKSIMAQNDFLKHFTFFQNNNQYRTFQ